MKKLDISTVTTLIFVLMIPTISLIFSNIYIPNILLSSELADWRLLSSIISFSGLIHLGIADGVYLSWLNGEENSLSKRFFIKVISIILLISILSGIAVSLVFSIESILLIYTILTLFTMALMSFAIYYVQIYLSGFILNISLTLQGMVFIILVFILSKFVKINSIYLLLFYCISCLPIIFIALRHGMVENKFGEFGISKSINLGLPIVVSNLGIIVFTNIDKIVSRHVFESDSSYASYSIQSSLFVAGAGLGISLGGIIISRKISLFNFRIRVIGLIVSVFAVFILSSPISTALNSLIKHYSVDYRLSIITGFIAFCAFSVYFAYSRIFYPKLLQKIFYTFPVLYILLSTAFKNYGQVFPSISLCFIAIYLLIAIAIHEIWFLKEGK